MTYISSLQVDYFLFAQQSLFLPEGICTVYYEIKLCITNELSSILGVFILQKQCLYILSTPSPLCIQNLINTGPKTS